MARPNLYIKRTSWTPEVDAEILRLDALKWLHREIAEALGNRTRRQVTNRLYTLKNPDYVRHQPKPAPEVIRYQKSLATGWPVPDRKRLNDWGKGFWDENIQEAGTTPRRLQAPVNHTVGGVAKYG